MYGHKTTAPHTNRRCFSPLVSSTTLRYVYNLVKYEFDLNFEIPVTYPTTAPELCLPELDGKTPKMYRGGKICFTIPFKPLWAKNVPHFGVAHAICLGLGPWLAAEV